jgi:hypothetical protein
MRLGQLRYFAVFSERPLWVVSGLRSAGTGQKRTHQLHWPPATPESAAALAIDCIALLAVFPLMCLHGN